MNKKKQVQKKYVPQRKQVAKKKATPKKVRKKVRRIRYGRVLLYIILPIILIIFISSFIHFPIRNIYISGNSLISDQEIIELAGISNYPSIFEYTSREMAKKIEKNKYIDRVKVKKKLLKEVHIEVTENVPLFYDSYSNKTFFSDGDGYSGNDSNSILLNYVPTDYLTKLKNGFINMNADVRSRISEIQYIPNDVDEQRFLLTMNDGNYVYITLSKIDLLDSYLQIIKNVDGKKGILYLDSGEYFEIRN